MGTFVFKWYASFSYNPCSHSQAGSEGGASVGRAVHALCFQDKVALAIEDTCFESLGSIPFFFFAELLTNMSRIQGAPRPRSLRYRHIR
jgi:hypothetical protein